MEELIEQREVLVNKLAEEAGYSDYFERLSAAIEQTDRLILALNEKEGNNETVQSN